MNEPRFKLGELVRKTRGSQWHGRIVGTYSTELTPDGYCVESAYEAGSVQIYPVGELDLWRPESAQCVRADAGWIEVTI